MKIEWEPCDIRQGLKVGKPNKKDIWMIGYDPTEDATKRSCLVSLTDGTITHKGSSQAVIASVLNQTGDVPPEFFPFLGNKPTP